MAAADLVVAGFGSWSTASKLITKGFDSAALTPPADGGMEWVVQDSQLSWLVANSRLEYVVPDTRLEWGSK